MPTEIDNIDTTRRAFIAMIAAAGLLSACGDDDSTSNDSSEPPTRGFVDVTGRTIQVPNRPARIVAIHDINAGVQLLSLGAPVVGIATRDEGARPDVTRYFDLTDIAEVGITYAPNIEAIAALRPDLIVGEGFDGAGMDQFMEGPVQRNLEALAPVVYIDTFRPVEEVMADFAELVGDSASASVIDQEAEFVIALDELVTTLGERVGELDVANISSGEELSVLGATTAVANDILTRAGVRWVPIVDEAGNDENAGFLTISDERLEEIESDLLVVGLEYDRRIVDSPLYQALRVVREGRVLEITEPTAGTHWDNYTAVARTLTAQLSDLDLSTDLI